MASAKLGGGKKQDEKHLKLLREMAALASNRHCFECGQRGPTYVNMTIGTFVCTACSGVLRGLNPPHRVKSISMASFTPEEIDFLKEHGNEYNRHVWLGLHDSKSPPSFESSEEHKLRDYLAQKYERKRWYMEPTADLKEQAKMWNTISAGSGAPTDPTSKPRTGSSLGPAPASVAITTSSGTTASPSAAAATAVLRLQQPPSGASPSAGALPASAYTTATPQSSSDLLSDLFAAPAPSAASAVGSFGAFSGTPAVVNQSNQPVPFGQAHVTPARAPVLLAGNSPQHTGMLPAGGSSAGAVKPSGLTATGGDKYAALADLFETSSSSQPPPVRATEPAVNWNTVNWGATQGVTPAPSSSGGMPHQKPAFSVGNAGGWSSAAPLSSAPAMSSWPSSASTASPLVTPGLAGAGFPQPQGAHVFHAATSPWAGMQPAAPSGGLSIAAPGGVTANPFLSSGAAASPMPFAAFPGTAGGPAQGKLPGSGFAVQAAGPATAQLAGGPFALQQQHSGFAAAGGIAGLGQPQQPAGVFPAQSALFGQPAPLGGLQAGASVGPQQNGSGGWASWSQTQPGPAQARAGTAAAATHSANPFATPVVGSMPSGNVTNPFL